jgi:hypothetical protein
MAMTARYRHMVFVCAFIRSGDGLYYYYYYYYYDMSAVAARLCGILQQTVFQISL